MAARNIVYIGSATSRRPPETEEEVRILYDLDMMAFDQLTTIWKDAYADRDPADLVWNVRKHFFRQFWGKQPVFPEARPMVGTRPVAWYDESRPWYVPGLELIERKSYPIGWDDYVYRGVKPVRRSVPTSSVMEASGRSIPAPAVPDVKEESTQLLAARKTLRDLEEAQALSEIEERIQKLRLESAARKDRMAQQKKAAEIEAEKAVIQARAFKSGQHGFGNPIASAPPATSTLADSRWNVPAKSSAAPAVRDEDFPRLATTSTKPKAQVVPKVKAALVPVPETAVQKERRVLGGEHKVEKKPGGTRNGMGRAPTEVIVAELRRKWFRHFEAHKEIVLKIKKETQCNLIPVWDEKDSSGLMRIEGKEGKPSASVHKALDMIICYAEDILKQEGSNVKNRYESMSEDSSCYTCGAVGHFKSACPKMECRNCGQKGHDIKKCPKPPQRTGLCYKCGKPGHKELECRSGKNPPASSKGLQPEQSMSQTSKARDVEKGVMDGIRWKTEYHQGLVKQDQKDREKLLRKIQELVIKLNDDGEPFPLIIQLSQLSTSAIRDEVTALERRLMDRDGPQGATIVYNETFKERKIPKVLEKKVAAPVEGSVGQAASNDTPLPTPQVAETASKVIEDKGAEPEEEKAAELKSEVSRPPSVSGESQASFLTTRETVVSIEKIKPSWASQCNSDYDETESIAEEPAKS